MLTRQGEEVRFEGACREFGKYMEGLGETDVVVLEASTGSFWWADQIEAKGARCFVVDPQKFRIIKDSWNKTDKHDARNLAKALWVHVATGEFGIPTVYKPTGVVRELQSQVELLISIKGVTPLIALAFLADVADGRRFRTLRKMNAYLGLVPRASNSGGKSRPGHMTRESRQLTRTILTKCVHHVAASSESLERSYRELREKRGTGRARIAVIRKLCGMMRRMLLSGKQYRWMDRGLYEKKLRQYERVLKRVKEERPAA